MQQIVKHFIRESASGQRDALQTSSIMEELVYDMWASDESNLAEMFSKNKEAFARISKTHGFRWSDVMNLNDENHQEGRKKVDGKEPMLAAKAEDASNMMQKPKEATKAGGHSELHLFEHHRRANAGT